MCNNCIHKPVCAKYTATGGHVNKCEHFKEGRKGHWIKNNHIVTCSVCGCIAIPHDGKDFCPYCGADMRGAEDG